MADTGARSPQTQSGFFLWGANVIDGNDSNFLSDRLNPTCLKLICRLMFYVNSCAAWDQECKFLVFQPTDPEEGNFVSGGVL